MEIENLSLQQLQLLATKVDEELKQLTSSFAQLRHAGTKFRASRNSLDAVTAGREMLIPLTSSVYVPGQINDAESFMIEIGTGYYVERTPDKAKEFCQRKMEMIKENMDKIGSAINSRRATLEVIGQAYNKKAVAAQQQGAAVKK